MKRNHNRKQHRGGFTLIEILLVLGLLGIVMSIFGGKVFSVFGRGQLRAAKLQIKQIEGSLDRYKLDCGSYPTTEQGLEALVTKPSGGKSCSDYDPEGYLGAKKVPVDPWKNPFKYECADGIHYTITSFANDGVEGGDGKNADIKSGED